MQRIRERVKEGELPQTAEVQRFSVDDTRLAHITDGIGLFRRNILTPQRVEYLDAIRCVVNPGDDAISGASIGVASDATSLLLSGNMTCGYFFDENEIEWQPEKGFYSDDTLRPVTDQEAIAGYIEDKSWNPGSWNRTRTVAGRRPRQIMFSDRPTPNPAFRGKILEPLLLELFSLGVNEVEYSRVATVTTHKKIKFDPATELDDVGEHPVWKLRFGWAHPGEGVMKDRVLFFCNIPHLQQSHPKTFSTHLSNMKAEPTLSQDSDFALFSGVDLFVEKAFDPGLEVLAFSYRRALSKLVRKGGFVLMNGAGTEPRSSGILPFPVTALGDERKAYKHVSTSTRMTKCEEAGLEFGYGRALIYQKTAASVEDARYDKLASQFAGYIWDIQPRVEEASGKPSPISLSEGLSCLRNGDYPQAVKHLTDCSKACGEDDTVELLLDEMKAWPKHYQDAGLPIYGKK
ncbi:hypothetical protein KKD84_05370 [Patescibacteria group bacterium]|nr:hypothetical protein [Patescibacteria group bacterium]